MPINRKIAPRIMNLLANELFCGGLEEQVFSLVVTCCEGLLVVFIGNVFSPPYWRAIFLKSSPRQSTL